MNATLRALHAYWLAKRSARRMPARRDISPIEIPSALPYLVLFELHDGRLRYRLTGSATVDLFGRDPTGSYLDEILPERRYRVATRSYELAIRQSRPLVSRSKFVTASGAIAMITRLVLPLSDDQIHANMILAGIEIQRGPGVIKELLGPDADVDPNVAIQFL